MYYLLLTSIIMLILDSIYLNITKNHFNKEVMNIQGSGISLNIYGAIMTYILMLLGLYYFIFKRNGSVLDAFILGIVIYGVFEGTTKAIFNNWSWISVLIDTLWGGILLGLTTDIVRKIKN